MYQTLRLCIVFIACLLLYLPAANGPYLVDDYPNLINNDELILKQIDPESLTRAATSSQTGSIGRPLSMLSFALNYTLAGDKDVYPVKLVNILLHLLTGVGIFILLKMLLVHWIKPGSDNIFWVALLATALWLFHPLQVSTVLYPVQRMTILSGLFTICGLIAYIKYRAVTIQSNSHFLTLLLSVSGLTILGVLSKENAILLPLFALLIETSVFGFAFHPQTSTIHRVMVRAILYIPLAAISGFLIYSYFNVSGEVIWPYSFTIDQRLMTQPRILMHYLGWILLINPEPMSLHHTDIGLSTGLFTPFITLPSILGLILLGGIAWFSLQKQRYPVLGFGLLWFLIGHLLESTTIPLELAYEHRNYLPLLGVLLIPAYFLLVTLDSVAGRRRMYIAAALVLLVLFLGRERVNIWRDEKTLILHSLDIQGDVSWSWADAADYLTRAGNPGAAIEAMQKAASLDPGEQAFLFGEANIRCLYMPDAAFPENLKSSLLTALSGNPLTITGINSLVSMIRVCQTTRTNDEIFRQLYGAATNQQQATVVDIGRRALAILDAKY